MVTRDIAPFSTLADRGIRISGSGLVLNFYLLYLSCPDLFCSIGKFGGR